MNFNFKFSFNCLIFSSFLSLLYFTQSEAKPFAQLYFPDDPKVSSLNQKFERISNPVYNFKFNVDDFQPSESKYNNDVILFPSSPKTSETSSSSSTNENSDFSINSPGGSKSRKIPIVKTKSLGKSPAPDISESPVQSAGLLNPESVEQIEAFVDWFQKQQNQDTLENGNISDLLQTSSASPAGAAGDVENATSDYNLASPIRGLNCPPGSKRVGGGCHRPGGGFE